ncbi:LacI family DNA-binding transcriptional regulator [Paenibacillus albidus]|uniref:LacI family DNA-binding transcriptional regulator n=1 Tax=Paenibacillus albidus TaxID=2041023 RepID=UPI001BECD520|nr:LacI family DNA-binding transcriptional regulator [Paenibacillus albidus]MBT2291801.1 LacI family DNA-binding transcriptional regulator [Paenibacillus albidus]
MSNLERIAKLSGFSKATVSRVLNHSPHVSQETRATILQIMKELDYVPNRNAISLSTGQTLQIGMITSSINEIMLPFLNGFVEVAEQHGFQTIIYTTSDDMSKERLAFEDLRQKRVDALVIISCVTSAKEVESYCKYGPIVSWQRMDNPAIGSVAMDQFKGYTLALDHLIHKGHTRIANALGRTYSINTRSRQQAYEQAMQKYNLPVLSQFYYPSTYTILDGERVMRSMLQQNEALPSAILCSNDHVAAGVLCEARRQHLRVPGDLAIVGFDDTELSHTLGITTIRNPIAAQAQNAFHLLSGPLRGIDMPQAELCFELIERTTT